MPRYILALGSCHRDGINYLDRATRAIKASTTIDVVARSSIVKNAAAKSTYNFLFYNCALAVTTKLPPHTMYRELFRLEHELGRIRSFGNAPRTLDIDVLLSLDLEYMSPNFFVPHVALRERNFFVIPAIEALKSAGWPITINVVRYGHQFGAGYLEPLFSN